MFKYIDTEKTIASNKIHFIFDGKSDKTGAAIVLVAGVIMPLILAMGYAVNNYYPIFDDLSAPIFFILILVFVSIFMLRRLCVRKKTKRFSNIDKEQIITALKVLNWNIISDDEKYMVIKPGADRRQISIVFDKNDVLIHSLIFTQFNYYDRETRGLNILIDVINKIKERS